MFTPYSRQMQLWPMTQSTLCPSHTSTLHRWLWTHCSATVTNPGDSEDDSWASSKRWLGTLGMVLFDIHFMDIKTYWFRGWTTTLGVEKGLCGRVGLRYLPSKSIISTYKANQALIDTSKQHCCQLYKFPVFITYFLESTYCNLLKAQVV